MDSQSRLKDARTPGTAEAPGPARFWPVAVAALIALLVFTWLGWAAAHGKLSQDDEFYTAERSREMLLLGPWTLHDNFKVSGVKPPLQYWLSAFTLARFHNRELALRVWTLLFGVLATITLAWLAAVIDRRRPWLIPLGVALLLTCPIFMRSPYSATLDAGLIFFTTLFIAAAQLARAQPAWWTLAAAACWLGALEKSPLILVVWIIIILLRLRNTAERETLRTRWLPGAFALALIAMAAWPTVQITQFHLSIAEILRYRELPLIVQRRAGAPYLYALHRLVTFWPCGVLALAAAVFVAFSKIQKLRSAPREISLLCLIVLGLCILSNTREVRHAEPILPCLCLLLALAFCWLLEQPQKIYRLLCLLITGLAVAGLPVTMIWVNRVQAAHWRNGVRRDIGDHTAIAQAMAVRGNSDKRLVIIEADGSLLPEDFYLFYGGINSHLENLTLAQLEQTPPAPMIGISTGNDFALVRKQFPNLRVNLTRDDLVCWEVD